MMSDILFFTLDDLGHRQTYVIAIFAIVLLAIAAVLLRDAWAWFEALGAEALETAEEEGDEPAPSDGALQAAANHEAKQEMTKAPAFVSGSHSGFGRRQREAA